MWEELSVSEPGASPQTSAPLSSTTSPCAPPAAGCAFIYPSPPAFCLPSFPRAYLWPSPFSSRPPQPELGHCARLVAGAINLRGQRAAWWASRSPINFVPPDAGQLHLCRWWPPSSAAGAGWPWEGAPGARWVCREPKNVTCSRALALLLPPPFFLHLEKKSRRWRPIWRSPLGKGRP